jgi:hypothetical protein
MTDLLHFDLSRGHGGAPIYPVANCYVFPNPSFGSRPLCFNVGCHLNPANACGRCGSPIPTENRSGPFTARVTWTNIAAATGSEV